MPISISTETISKGWSELFQRLSFYIIFYSKCGMVMQLAKGLSKLFRNDFAYFQTIVTFKAHYIFICYLIIKPFIASVQDKVKHYRNNVASGIRILYL